MRNQKGITLIALIITIIVMLILVAVTVSVALTGGIFNNAREAKTGTQRQAEKEELIAKMVGAYTSAGNFATSNVGELPSGARWCTNDTETWEDAEDLEGLPTGNGDWVITKNNNKFYVDSSGSVLDEKPQETVYAFTIADLRSNGVTLNYDDGNEILIIDKGEFVNYIGEEPFTDTSYYETIEEVVKYYRINSSNTSIGNMVEKFFDNKTPEQGITAYICLIEYDGELTLSMATEDGESTSELYATLKASENVEFYFKKGDE